MLSSVDCFFSFEVYLVFGLIKDFQLYSDTWAFISWDLGCYWTPSLIRPPLLPCRVQVQGSHLASSNTRREGRGFLFPHSVQFSSVAQSCPTLCSPMNCSTSGLPVHHQFREFTETHVHRVGDAIQPSHPLSSPSPPAPNPSQHQSLFHWVNSSHEVAKVLEFQL